MRIDLYHNAILKQTVTEGFERELRDRLVPRLSAIFGDRLRGVQMYEDYLNDGFVRDGYCYYPMTAILDEGYSVVWVKWSVANGADFCGGVPYSFVGQSLDFIIADDTPEEFRELLSHRSSYFEGGCVKLNITTTAKSVTFLSGKFSQSFIDELARQISARITESAGVVGLADSTIELDMVFSPESYMEHTSDNVTYRRLLMSAKGCAPRDFWVKWRGKNGEAYSSRDAVSSADIEFSLGEDVPHKAREKEYRYLVSGNSDKYRTAMGKKNITEWRELIKRAVKRGELTKTTTADELSAHSEEISDRVAQILERYNIQTPDSGESAVEASDDIAGLAREKLMGYTERQGEAPVYEAPSQDGSASDFDIPEVPSFDFSEQTASPDPITYPTSEAEPFAEAPVASVTLTKTEYEPPTVEESFVVAPARMPDIPTEITPSAPVPQPTPTVSVDEGILRQRLNEESCARAELEGELKKSRLECEELRERVENLSQALRICEENLKREIEARAFEEVKLKEQIELEAKERAREKELFAEAARRQREETERILREQEEAEARRLTEEARRESERLEREAREREEREREAEIRRIEGAARVREDSQGDALTRAQQISRQMELEARQRMQAFGYTAPVTPAVTSPEVAAPTPVEAEAPTVVQTPPPVREVTPISPANHPYTSFNAKLIFCHNVDPNVTGRIKEILALGLEYYKKEHVYIKLRARITEPNVVTLEFYAFPEGEQELLEGLIKLIGNADLGIMKVIIE